MKVLILKSINQILWQTREKTEIPLYVEFHKYAKVFLGSHLKFLCIQYPYNKNASHCYKGERTVS
jgi:hypothetical protein